MILVYVTVPDDTYLEQSILDACKLMEKGFSVFISHGQPSRFVILERCNAVLVASDNDAEIDVALDHNILIFQDVDKLISFFERDTECQ